MIALTVAKGAGAKRAKLKHFVPDYDKPRDLVDDRPRQSPEQMDRALAKLNRKPSPKPATKKRT